MTDSERATYLGVLVVGVISIVTLMFVVIIQRRKITHLTKPKYGFLGKPLAFILAGIFAASGYAFYSAESTSEEPRADISVSDVQNMSINIVITELSKSDKLYRFNAIPYIENKEWGNEKFKYDIYWSFESQNITQTDVETGLSKFNPGGIPKQLPAGITKITATIFTDERIVEQTINYTVE